MNAILYVRVSTEDQVGNTTVYQLTTPATLATPAHGRSFGGSVNENR